MGKDQMTNAQMTNAQMENVQTDSAQTWEMELRQERARLNALWGRHAQLFGGKDLRSFTGISSVPEGWLIIVDNLFARLERHLGARAREFVPGQIKEKFGELRFSFRLALPQEDGANPNDDDLDDDSPIAASADLSPAVLTSPPRVCLRVRMGPATEYAFYEPDRSIGQSDERGRLLAELREIVSEACMLTSACCIYCGERSLPLLNVCTGYIHTLCLRCAKQHRGSRASAIQKVRKNLVHFFKNKRSRGYISFWRVIRNGEVCDFIAMEDVPQSCRAQLVGLAMHEVSELGPAVRIEDFYKHLGIDWSPMYFSEDKLSGESISIGEYWRRRFGVPFPSLPPIERNALPVVELVAGLREGA